MLERLPLRSAAGMPAMYLADMARTALTESFAAELNAWEAGAQIYAILHVSVRAGTKPYADVNKVALMRVSERLIPLDSGHEATVEKLLYDNQRSFYNPLRFDSALDAVFPDFWLLDMVRDYPMEVFGMNTPEYLARRWSKLLTTMRATHLVGGNGMPVRQLRFRRFLCRLSLLRSVVHCGYAAKGLSSAAWSTNASPASFRTNSMIAFALLTTIQEAESWEPCVKPSL